MEESTKSEIRQDLALAFIVRNEGEIAVQMLQSILPLVGFVACLDTGSDDGTLSTIENFLREVGKPYLTRSTQFTRFDEMRNLAISMVPRAFRWVLMLDADEIILEKDFAALAQLIKSETVDAWGLPRITWIDSIFGNDNGSYPDFQGRLFRNNLDYHIHYRGKVHETLDGYRNMQFAPTDDKRNEATSAVNIHHLKLIQKSSSDIQDRESLYKSLSELFEEKDTQADVYRTALNAIWGNTSPYGDLKKSAGREDLQGWGAKNHPLLLRALDEVRPKVVVEVGVWKGQSAISMAQHMRDNDIPGVVVAVDTWLGAWDHWLQPEWFSHLKFEGGYPTIFRTFMANIVAGDVMSHVIPLPLDSVNASQVISSRRVLPGVIHIDGAHDFASVMSDLRAWWPLLQPGGVLIGDDYHPTGDSWPEVRAAFHEFFQVTELESLDCKCYIRKDL